MLSFVSQIVKRVGLPPFVLFAITQLLIGHDWETKNNIPWGCLSALCMSEGKARNNLIIVRTASIPISL